MCENNCIYGLFFNLFIACMYNYLHVYRDWVPSPVITHAQYLMITMSSSYVIIKFVYMHTHMHVHAVDWSPAGVEPRGTQQSSLWQCEGKSITL